jgi:hypothetical protein
MKAPNVPSINKSYARTRTDLWHDGYLWLQDAAKQYLKLLVLTAASGGNVNGAAACRFVIHFLWIVFVIDFFDFLMGFL